MNYKQILILIFIMALSKSFTSCDSKNKNAKAEFNSSDVIKKMNVKEKAQLVVGTGMYLPLPDSILKQLPIELKDRLDYNSEYGKMVKKIRQYLPGSAGVTAEFPQYGITSQTLADGPAGLRILPTREGQEGTFYATAFPIGTLLASTWNKELVNKVGHAMGEEVLEYGADVLLAPALNLQRDPLNGRNFEYYSEDPLVSGKTASAMINGIQSNGVGTSVKHFAVNNQETNRMTVNTILSERALRELYLRGFEIAVKEAKPWTVMSSYNKVNGKYTSEDKDLLTTILRDEWGFDGYVMTDWGGGSDIVAQLKSGNDMIQPGSPEQIDEVVNAVKKGDLKESELDKNVERILDVMQKTPRFKGYEPTNQPDLKAHAKVARQAATEGMVLLENKDKALPLNQSIQNIAAFGANSYDFISGGTGSGDVNEAYTVSLIEGLENANYNMNDELKKIYQNYITETEKNQPPPENQLTALLGGKLPIPEMQLDKAVAKKMAKKSDIALITIGRNAGEGEDRKAEAGDFYLTDIEKSMIKNVSEAFHAQGKKAIVILNIAGVIETASWKNIPDAILCTWLPGQEAGDAVVDVLSGKTNPSGKLATTFPKLYKDTSTSDYFPGYAVEGDADDKQDESGFSFMKREPWEVVYQEDIFVGYRYFQTFDVPVSYEFGYGQSYTSFEYDNLKLDKTNFKDNLKITVNIKNTGEVSGKEVVQVYVSAPNGKLIKPKSELVAFGKTKSLEPGQSETLSFDISAKDLASFDEDNSAWLVEAGDYVLKVGASSEDIKLEQNFKVNQDIIVEEVHKVMTPKQEIEVLRP
ncbi:glycoside hydrolase family 3 protein [Flavobacterium sp. CS20]|uniref:beta-glucosidase n=1 Tax=Flavobacterium sp. CS20 TaxID=2775246 RepID=UPI001B3A5297|nr:glycoside hydrolase family 3 protein [Flavobacterium sp. CS20]QTY28170.1 glycoside hydrolase family 3 protein [Flavobacterium sp. CS20]